MQTQICLCAGLQQTVKTDVLVQWVTIDTDLTLQITEQNSVMNMNREEARIRKDAVVVYLKVAYHLRTLLRELNYKISRQ
jgi:hypothetical protein